ncbi:MAG: TonB-dependent receptor plug domain-containing protein [Pseudomonas sp.]|nr:TonB-dependent receptor plug domain-containing protein [Pseudomonas sp.]
MLKRQKRLAVGTYLVGVMSLAQAHAQPAEINLPALSLSQAVQQLTSNAGIKVEGLEHLSSQKMSELNGDLNSLLHRLLNSAQVEWSLQGKRLVILPKSAGTANTMSLPISVVVADRASSMGKMKFDREFLENRPSGNGDLTSVLKIHPNVQFDNAQLSSKTPGEISPANISINGAQFYQNAFIVDGVGFNNDIDPAEDNPALLASAPGRSQGLALDTDLLDSITVYDSNVPAAYGRFTGGVVEANTRAPSQELHGKISAQTTRSSWTRYHIDKSQQESFESSGRAADQPEFTKMTTRGTLEGHLTENFGLMGSFSQKRSTIPLSMYSANNVERMGYHKETQKREIDNYFIKAHWQISDALILEGSVTHAPETNHYFAANVMNSGVDLKSGGQQYALKLKWDTDWAYIEQNLAYGALEQSRDSDENDYFTWRKSVATDWGIGDKPTTLSLDGGYGDIEQKQKTYQYKLAINGLPWQTGSITQHWSTGLEASWQHVNYERLTESGTYVSPKQASSCVRADGSLANACLISPTINGWTGQYLSQRTRFTTGEFDFTTRELAAYLQNDIHIGRVQVRPGVRLDHDNYMQKTTVAPRLAVEYDVFADQSTVFTAGANRYYGRNISSWRLQDGRNRLRFTDTRANTNADWQTTAQATNSTLFNTLDIPYDDEWVLGLKQRVAGVELGLKYVNRTGKDQVIQVKGDTLGQPSTDPTLSKSYSTYTNDGRSRADIITLTAQPLQSLEFAGTQTAALLALDWTKSKSNAPDYSDSTEAGQYYENDYIQYKGRVIHYADRPADNFHRPWTARLNTITQMDAFNLTLSNFLRYRAGYAKAGTTGKKVDYQGQLINVWDEIQYSAAVTWDMRIAWDLPFSKDQAAFVNVDIFNVLDKKVVTEGSNSLANNVPTYEIGRQFWLEVGYRF